MKKETVMRNFRLCEVLIDCLNDLKTGSPSLSVPCRFLPTGDETGAGVECGSIHAYFKLIVRLVYSAFDSLLVLLLQRRSGEYRAVYVALCRESGNTGVTFSSMVTTNMQPRRRNRNIVIHRTIELLFMCKTYEFTRVNRNSYIEHKWNYSPYFPLDLYNYVNAVILYLDVYR